MTAQIALGHVRRVDLPATCITCRHVGSCTVVLLSADAPGLGSAATEVMQRGASLA